MKKDKVTNKILILCQQFKNGNWLKSSVFWARFAAYAIPLSFLAYVLYINYLPFGYNKTFIIDVGAQHDTRFGEFYLEPSKDLSERKTGTDESGNEYTYRELNGVAYAVFRPKVVLKDAQITVEVEGEGVSIIPPVIDFDPDSIEWDYSWDFTQGKTAEELGLRGTAFPFDGGMYFNGRDTRLELPDSQDKFEDGAFSVYVEWEPRNLDNSFQQVVGHYNWEILQNRDSVSFQIGRMNDANGDFYSVRFPISNDFANKKHSLLVNYSPSNKLNESGHIDLYVNNIFGDRITINKDKIWTDYGQGISGNNLSLGRSRHANSSNFTGYIYQLKILENSITHDSKKIKYQNLILDNFLITGQKDSLLKSINLYVVN